MPRLVPLALLLCLCIVATPGQTQPQRIVSLNLCTDQLLLLLVERERIASLSRFAADPAWSWLADAAAGIPTNRGQAEEVLRFGPDLVLTSQFSATLAANLLERLGHPVVRLGFASTLEEVYAQIREIAVLTGTSAEGDILIAGIADRIDRTSADLYSRLAGKRALFLASNGFSYGSGTLQDAFLHDVGLRNIAAEAGVRGPAPMPLELLLVARPDFIFHDPLTPLDTQLAHPLLLHPALAALGEGTRRLTLPEAWFQCAGPQVALAWESLREQLDAF